MDSIPFYLSYAALWILIILHSLVLLGVVRIVYQLHQSSSAGQGTSVGAGQEAPAFSAIDLSGMRIDSADFAGRLTALLFVSPDCPSCKEILEDGIGYLYHKAQGNLIVICRAGREDCIRLTEQYKLDVPIIADEDYQISQLYSISSLPTAILISENNRIQSYGQPHREELVQAFKEAPDIEFQVVSQEGNEKHVRN